MLFHALSGVFHAEPVVAFARRRNLIEPVALRHVDDFRFAGFIDTLMHDQQAGAAALEMHLSIDRAMRRAQRRADRSGQT